MMLLLILFVGLSLLPIADDGFRGQSKPNSRRGNQMSADLKILAWVAVLTALMWLPYILTRMLSSGIMRTLTYEADSDPLPVWAARAKKAHYNAVENLRCSGSQSYLYSKCHNGFVGYDLPMGTSGPLSRLHGRYSLCANPCLCRRLACDPDHLLSDRGLVVIDI